MPTRCAGAPYHPYPHDGHGTTFAHPTWRSRCFHLNGPIVGRSLPVTDVDFADDGGKNTACSVGHPFNILAKRAHHASIPFQLKPKHLQPMHSCRILNDVGHRANADAKPPAFRISYRIRNPLSRWLTSPPEARFLSHLATLCGHAHGHLNMICRRYVDEGLRFFLESRGIGGAGGDAKAATEAAVGVHHGDVVFV